ncbi:hypothetical protein KSP39_PZI004347 [Platanthera zijinensis]|uniref:Uncharacterized protein n=1 Tax=Platanthera zijinensis TaxID=2320716 RepID=A0AAP0BU61_9ASPA
MLIGPDAVTIRNLQQVIVPLWEPREEELLMYWWKEFAECSEGPNGSSRTSDSRDVSIWDELYVVEEERVGVPVKGGLYEVHNNFGIRAIFPPLLVVPRQTTPSLVVCNGSCIAFPRRHVWSSARNASVAPPPPQPKRGPRASLSTTSRPVHCERLRAISATPSASFSVYARFLRTRVTPLGSNSSIINDYHPQDRSRQLPHHNFRSPHADFAVLFSYKLAGSHIFFPVLSLILEQHAFLYRA